VDASAQILNNGNAARELAASAATTAAALAPTSEKKDETRDDNENWMNALNSVSAGRAHEIARDTTRLSTPVHDSRWADALAHRLVMMAKDGESVAQLKLVPQDLGPLDIQISVRDGEASVHFGAANAETRAVLESSMPRLRELLSAQGLQLTNSSVSHQSGGQNRPERNAGRTSVGAVEEAEGGSAQAVSTSLLDIYA
jgi:flagellar hook-length control protein FliK